MPAAEKTKETRSKAGPSVKGRGAGRREQAPSIGRALEAFGGSESSVLEAVQLQAEALPGKLNFKIGEAARLLGLKPHVLRFWESRIPALRPKKLNGGQRLYFKKDMEALLLIKAMVYGEKLALRGAARRLPGCLRILRQNKLKAWSARDCSGFQDGQDAQNAEGAEKIWRRQRRRAKAKLYQLLDSIAEAKARITKGGPA